MAYKQAALAARSSGGSGGTGGSGGSGGGGSGYNELSYKDRLIRATELAKADPRLAGVYDEEKGTFTLAQLVDAYLNII
jgi:hypothetical protein